MADLDIRRGDVARVAFGQAEALVDVEDPNLRGQVLVDRITDGHFGGNRMRSVEPDQVIAVYRKVEHAGPPAPPSATPGVGRPETGSPR